MILDKIPFDLTPVPFKQQRACVDCGAIVTHKAWSPYWCPRHDLIRINRITRQMEELAAKFEKDTP